MRKKKIKYEDIPILSSVEERDLRQNRNPTKLELLSLQKDDFLLFHVFPEDYNPSGLFKKYQSNKNWFLNFRDDLRTEDENINELTQDHYQVVQGGSSVLNLAPMKRYIIDRITKRLKIKTFLQTTKTLGNALDWVAEHEDMVRTNYGFKGDDLFRRVIKAHVGAKVKKTKKLDGTCFGDSRSKKMAAVLGFKTLDFRYIGAF